MATSSKAVTKQPQRPPKASQAAQLGSVSRELAEHPAIGIKPVQLMHLLKEAEAGDLKRQAELFQDMEERDAHLLAEISKRKRALLGLQWQIAPPVDASRQETEAAELLTSALEERAADLFFNLLDGIGHGFCACEIEWQLRERYWLPAHFHYRPQAWFTLDENDQSRLLLRRENNPPVALQPYGWIVHQPIAKSGYVARAGLYRVLAMPCLLKHYSVHSLSEFLEIYGIPLRLGKYSAGSTDDEKAKLMQLVKNMGHSAAGIVPETQLVEFIEAAKGTSEPYQFMLRYCDEAISKAILGGTLTSNTSESGGGAHALGKVHNEVRRDLMESDARQLAATINRDLIAPFCAINFAHIRPPRLVFDLQQNADITALSQALPPLLQSGMKIPERWLYEQLGIPQPDEGEAILQGAANAVQALTRQLASRQTPSTRKGERWQELLDAAVPTNPDASAINAPLLKALHEAKDENEALELLSRALPDSAPESLTGDLERLLLAAEMAGRLSFEKHG